MPEREDQSRDLLCGLLALERGLIDVPQALAAFRIWRERGESSMLDVLRELGAIDARGRKLLEKLAQAHGGSRADSALEVHGDETVIYTSPAAHVTVDGHAEHAPPGPRFHILRPHAKGGLGELFIALDPELNREVALKELPASFAHDPGSQSRFVLEAQVTGRLEHPGIVPVYGLGRYGDGRPYYAMRFIEGETLKQAIDRFYSADAAEHEGSSRELTFRRLLRSIIDACNAVAYAHSRGILHRDLKPENIMLGAFGETLVVDWGLAKPLVVPERPRGATKRAHAAPGSSALTSDGIVVGTPQYMSPEQAAGEAEHIGPATDVYGLGATLYCLLTGRAPFAAGEVRAVLRQVKRGIFPGPTRIRKQTDRTLEAICLKAMARAPGERFNSPLALAAELEAWLADLRYRGEQEAALNQTKRTLARLCFERAQNHFARDMHPQGMLWLARALENVPAGSPALDRAIRTSLHGWHVGGKPVGRSLAHASPIVALAFSSESRRLATACEDHTIRLWDLSTGSRLLPPIDHGAAVHCIALSDDQAITTAGVDGSIKRWDANTGGLIGGVQGDHEKVLATLTSRAGLAGVSLGKRGRLVLRDDALRELTLEAKAGEGQKLTTFALADDGSLLAAASAEGQIRIWETAKGRLAGKPLAHEGEVRALAFHPSGAALLSIPADGTATIWDLQAHSTIAQFANQGAPSCVQISPTGGVIATAGREGSARLWDAQTGQPVGEPLEHTAAIVALAFSHDGRMLATASEDGQLRLWDAEIALALGPPLAHSSAITALAFSPDGQRLATGHASGQARCIQIPLPLEGEPERIACWVSVSTGLEFDPGDAIRPVDHLTAWELRRRLHDLGGTPIKKH